MNNMIKITSMAALVLGLAGSPLVVAEESLPPPLPIEKMGTVESLPERYPEHWFLVHDATFFHMLDGKVVVVDATAETGPEQYKGALGVSFIGSVHESAYRPEIYVIESFNTRGPRGDRTDVLTIWDRSTLEVLDEVVWPTPKRYQGLPERFAMQTINNGKWLLVFNFSPAGSVTVVDLDKREIINEVAIPGCVLIYPTGKLGFSSLCADGRFLSTQLTPAGQIASQQRGDVFFDSDDTPIFEHAASIDGVTYFPSFDGMVHPVDMRGDIAIPGEAWSLVTDEERTQNWRPGGIGIIDEDELGRFYVLMHPDGGDGTQGGGGSEVWVFDPVGKKRVQRIALKEWGLSVTVSRGKNPLLLVTNPVDMSLETYDGQTGEFKKKMADLPLETPLLNYGAK